jgi:hypothetical protein
MKEFSVLLFQANEKTYDSKQMLYNDVVTKQPSYDQKSQKSQKSLF